MSQQLISDLLKGDPRALARAITIVENSLPDAAQILSAIQPHRGKSTIIGLTGPPGAGKSTLIDALIKELRKRRKTVGVLAVDPSSSLTGGAILGDRIRMASHTGDAGVFVRSLASRGHLGGLFATAWGVLQVMDAAGPDFIILETVGTGQSEVEVADYVQVNIVVCAPGLGDDVQAIKAGILEIADILVVNKSDNPLAGNTVRQLESMLSLRNPAMATASVLSTTATTGMGIPELVDAVQRLALKKPVACAADREARRVRRVLADTLAVLVRRVVLTAEDPTIDALCHQVECQGIGMDAAADELVQVISRIAGQKMAAERS
jgi:LAO/AO transport system kinase